MNVEEVARFPAPGLNAPVKFSFGVEGRLGFLSNTPKSGGQGCSMDDDDFSDSPSLSKDLYQVHMTSESPSVECLVSASATGGNTEANLSLEEKIFLKSNSG